ncbi:16S rRNA (cytosine(967)-C(5))-methyltransferase RsmB [Aerococcaceae bacterium WGS1372]
MDCRIFVKKRTTEEVEEILASLQLVPHISARVNTTLISREDLIVYLEKEEGIKVRKSLISEYGIIAEEGNLVNSDAFMKGWLTIQDESSMLVAPLGRLKGSERVLDACAAPGGKATHIAQFLTDGHLSALDISEKKLERVKEHLVRLELDDKVTLYHQDATKYLPNDGQKYDIIYLDAPCSGLGLMRRKPEIKYDKSYQDVIELAEIQKNLLDHLSTLLNDGGTIVYSTCTVTSEENEQVMNQFLKTHSDFEHKPVSSEDNIPSDLITSEGNIRVWPDQYQTDGFFIGKLIKKSKN